MKDYKYERGDSIYFVNGLTLVKAFISEIFVHYQIDKTVVKYSVRPYGLKDYVTIDEDKIYTDFQFMKEELTKNLREAYTKERIEKDLDAKIVKLQKEKEEKLKDYDSDIEKMIQNINNVNERFFEVKEKKYQKQLKKDQRRK